MNFIPAPSSETLVTELNRWTDNLALLRGDNLYDLARIYFATKGWNTHQHTLEADVPYGSTIKDNNERIIEIVERDILKPMGLKFIKHIMGRIICTDDAIVGCLVNPTSNATKASYDVLGTQVFADYFKAKFQALIDIGDTNYMTRLSLTSDGGLTSGVEAIPPMFDIPTIGLFYPFLERTPEQQWQEFAASDSNVMLLIGPPGTGKSNYILQMMKARGFDDKIHIADRSDVLANPGLSDYIRNCPAGSVMITEDSDDLVRARTEGNSVMSALLNTASGIISRNVKIIISTNLESLKHVDDALVRPGRCFDILTFKSMSAQDGDAVRDMMGLAPVEFKEEQVTLAEALKYHEMHRNRVRKSSTFGFNQG